jgi:hypothetical protein
VLVATCLLSAVSICCYNDDDARQIKDLRDLNTRLVAERAGLLTRLKNAEAALTETERQHRPPTRAAVEQLLNESSAFCCRIASIFDAKLISNSSAEAANLVACGLAVRRNGEVWPSVAHDEHWQPLGKSDAADGWPPDAATNIFWWVRPADRRVTNVTGVARTDDDSAVVDFEWRWRLNAFGESLGRGNPWMDDTYHARATLRLYDDGWRVDRAELGERHESESR